MYDFNLYWNVLFIISGDSIFFSEKINNPRAKRAIRKLLLKDIGFHWVKNVESRVVREFIVLQLSFQRNEGRKQNTERHLRRFCVINSRDGKHGHVSRSLGKSMFLWAKLRRNVTRPQVKMVPCVCLRYFAVRNSYRCNKLPALILPMYATSLFVFEYIQECIQEWVIYLIFNSNFYRIVFNNNSHKSERVNFIF